MILHLFGGSFDPPHFGHLAVAKYFSTLSDVVIISPLLISQEKSPHVAGDLRLQMCELAFQGLPKVQVTSIDLERGGTTYTIDTVNDIQNAYPDAEIHLVVGEDALATIPHWKESQKLLDQVTLDVVKRPGSGIGLHNDFPYELHDIDAPDISSTQLRKALQFSELDESEFQKLIALPVLQFIQKNRLYQA